MDLIELFKQRELVIDIYKASEDDMKTLDAILDIRWRSGQRLYETMEYVLHKRYLQYDTKMNVIGYTSDPGEEVYNLTVKEFIRDYECKCKDIEDEEFAMMFEE